MPRVWKWVFGMDLIEEALVAALLYRHLMKAEKERSGYPYGYPKPLLEEGNLTQSDTVIIGRDDNVAQEDRKFIPIMVNKLDGKLRLTERDSEWTM